VRQNQSLTERCPTGLSSMLLKLKTMSVPEPDVLMVRGYLAVERIFTKFETNLKDRDLKEGKIS
jgi:hypothetical protein